MEINKCTNEEVAFCCKNVDKIRSWKKKNQDKQPGVRGGGKYYNFAQFTFLY